MVKGWGMRHEVAGAAAWSVCVCGMRREVAGAWGLVVCCCMAGRGLHGLHGRQVVGYMRQIPWAATCAGSHPSLPGAHAPLCPSTRMGWASGHLGVVFVENRLW